MIRVRGLKRTMAVVAAGATAAAVLAAPEVTKGPTAVYWIDATTETGATGDPGRMSMSDMMAMATGGAGAVHKSLWLRLGSDQPTGDPRESGSHKATAALDAKPFLLTAPTPSGTAAPAKESPVPATVPQGSGELLVFWGCGAHVGPGQPRRIDLGKSTDPAVIREMQALLTPALGLASVSPPSSTRQRAFLEWPQPSDRRRLREDASLVGRHVVTAPSSPTIDLTLGAADDFLPPVRVAEKAATGDGALTLGWQPVTGAKAIVVTAAGAAPGAKETAVLWASSQLALAWHQRGSDFLTDRDQARLVANGTLLPGTATRCDIPAEVASKLKAGGIYRIQAYGPDSDRSWPPRPADPKQPWKAAWTVKVRHRSVTAGLLGLGGQEASNGREEEEICGQQCTSGPEKKKKRSGLLGRLRDITGQ